MERRRRTRQTSRIIKKIKLVWIVKTIIYALGIYSFFYSERQFSVTLISNSTLITIGIILGLVASIIIERNYKYYLFSIIILGSLFTGIFFRLNVFFASRTEVKLKERILYKAMVSAKAEYSRVTIGYENYNKDIAISGDQEPLIGSAEFIIMTARKGGFGYYIITDRELVKK